MNTLETVPHYTDNNAIPPAQLWIGHHDNLVDNTIAWLQKVFCSHQGCTICTTCHAIRMQQHHAVTWLAPEKQYTLDQLSVIGNTISFALDADEHYFFILQKADALTPVCSNSLLKSIEEPPRGYHFILLTHRPQDLLATIRSRCVEQSWIATTELVPHRTLFNFFTTTTTTNPGIFLKELELTKINERESVELIDQLLAYWIKKSSTALIAEDMQIYATTQRVITILTQAVLMPPMPGSSNLFWKNLYLSFTALDR